jgi:hypothetical protein
MFDRPGKGIVHPARRPAVRLGSGLAILLVMVGCATAPEEGELRPERFLLDGYSAYFGVDVAANRELIHSVVEDLAVDQTVIERTASAAGGVNPSRGAGPDLSLVAIGDFPKRAVQFGLRRDRAFSRHVDEIEGQRQVYFENDQNGLQLAVPQAGRIYASTGRLFAMIAGDPLLPSESAAGRVLSTVGFDDGPEAVLVLPEPGTGILGYFGIEARGLPVRTVTLALGRSAEDDGLSLSGSVVMNTPEEALLLSRLGRFFLLALVRGLGLDLQATVNSAQVVSDGNAMVFDGVPVSQAELTALVKRLVGADAAEAEGEI